MHFQPLLGINYVECNLGVWNINFLFACVYVYGNICALGDNCSEVHNLVHKDKFFVEVNFM